MKIAHVPIACSTITRLPGAILPRYGRLSSTAWTTLEHHHFLRLPLRHLVQPSVSLIIICETLALLSDSFRFLKFSPLNVGSPSLGRLSLFGCNYASLCLFMIALLRMLTLVRLIDRFMSSDSTPLHLLPFVLQSRDTVFLKRVSHVAISITHFLAGCYRIRNEEGQRGKTWLS